MGLYLRQLQLGPMKNFVYLVGPQDEQITLVVDPAWDIDAVRAAARADGREITGAFLTHHHHDHINGLPVLLQDTDLPVYAQGEEVAFSAELQYYRDVLRPLRPGDELPLGRLRAKAIHTPGHTPGSHCLLVEGHLFTGDTLFVDHCGRCDFVGGSVDQMFHSLRDTLLKLPRETGLYPGHDYGEVPVSSMQREAAHNPYLQPSDLEGFRLLRTRPRT